MKKMQTKPIVLLTDFGISDPYVGIMKGVIHTIAPKAKLIDLSHNIPSGDIFRGAITLWQSISYFPKGAIFLCVVDPGVGSQRKGIILESNQQLFVGPDNGLFSFIINQSSQAWELTNPQLQLKSISHTFHGRDIFAPAAAHLWNEVPATSFGESVPNPVKLPPPTLSVTSNEYIEGEILYFDKFGNAITSIGTFREDNEKDVLYFAKWAGKPLKHPLQLRRSSCQLFVNKSHRLPMVKTFSEIPSNRCAMIIGSSGLIEIVANRKSAKEILGINRGDKVTLACKPFSGEKHG